jgi:hypothetical protein
MMKNRLLSLCVIFATMVATMGDSLHGLPFFDHHETETCDVLNQHVDAAHDEADSGCEICNELSSSQTAFLTGFVSFGLLGSIRTEPAPFSLSLSTFGGTTRSRAPPHLFA